MEIVRRIGIKRILAFVLLLGYLIVLLKLIVFKYPGVHFSPEYNFVPLKTILPYLTGYPTWIVARNNLLGNIIPFIPLGFLVPLFYHSISWKGILGIAVALSLCIEILQLVLRAGTFDVDDILLNVLGVALGYALFASYLSITHGNKK